MGEVTGIGWTDHTWSPWWGCTQVSPACDHCYAKALDKRVGGDHWGVGKERRQMSEAHWRAPIKWNKAVPASETRFVFPSMCDPFDNEVPAEWRKRFFDLIRATPNLTWLLLTKRIGNAADNREGAMIPQAGGLPANAALGATVCNKPELDRDLHKLLWAKVGGAIDARMIFLSIEPMLGPVSFSNNFWYAEPSLKKLDWVICGGESGPHNRPMNPEWPRQLRDECAAACVPFFFKQWGGRTPKANGKELDGREWCERPRLQPNPHF